MTEGIVGILLFTALVIGISIVCHIKIHRFWVASILTTVSAPLLFQLVGYIYLGHLDPFFLIALAVSTFWAFLGTSIIGYLVRRDRRAPKIPSDAT